MIEVSRIGDYLTHDCLENSKNFHWTDDEELESIWLCYFKWISLIIDLLLHQSIDKINSNSAMKKDKRELKLKTKKWAINYHDMCFPQYIKFFSIVNFWV